MSSGFRIDFTAQNSDSYPGGSEILNRLMAKVSAAFAKIERSMGLPNGIAPLDANGLIPASFLTNAASMAQTLNPSTLMVSTTAAVNTALTATLPAVTGQFHYITQIELVKLYAVAGVASGAGVIVTSTNLPGSPSWTTEQIVATVGSAPRVISLNLSGSPLKSSAVGTATTFVAPAQTQTIWRWNITYFTAT